MGYYGFHNLKVSKPKQEANLVSHALHFLSHLRWNLSDPVIIIVA